MADLSNAERYSSVGVLDGRKKRKKSKKGRADALKHGNQHLASNAILRLTMASCRQQFFRLFRLFSARYFI
jgi:hypothetical protein